MHRNNRNRQFLYWHAARKGTSHAEIARSFAPQAPSRQAVNKAVRKQVQKQLFRLLDAAETAGVLVEWQDADIGVLVGVSPQLGGLAAIFVVDATDRIQLFYDQTNNPDVAIRSQVLQKLANLLNEVLGLSVKSGTPVKEVIDLIVASRR
jgi:hypothetical protein